ncbi:MAG: hypothetical protein IPM16_14060 [Chloroflexi bacterium]|nr:hypothetical protein [Chloroflexota bacterium]
MVTDSMSSMFEPLTGRERQILALIAEGLSDQEISARLHLAVSTVKTYNRQIYQKFGVKNRRQAVARAKSLGWLENPESTKIPPHNLPTQLTPFVGRIGELEALSRWLVDANNRLLTVTAPGGMGKTRLVLDAAQSALALFPDGVFFVPLAQVDKPDDVIEAVVSYAGVPRMQDGRLPFQQACAFFANKHVLLVLDNFEHVLDAGGMLTALLQAAPKLKALVTSRERLDLTAETVFPINGLHYPSAKAERDLREYGAVELFVQSALHADPRFIVSEREIAAICRLAQGMPLAIELAAAWVSSMSLTEIIGEIERSADFLSTELRDVPDRLRSIRAVFETTWAHLSEQERRTFAALSVFRGGFTSDAAKHVAGAAPRDINALVGKALLWKDPETGRLSIHELLRQYAADALDRAGETARVRDAHRTYFAAYTETWTTALRTDEINALAHLHAEYDNIAVAFENAIVVATPEALLPFTDIWNYYTIRGLLYEGARVLDAAIAAIDGPDSLALGKLLGARSELAMYLGQNSREDETATRCLNMIKRLGARDVLPFAHAIYGNGVLRDDPARRYVNHVEGYNIADELGDDWGMCVHAYLAGWSLLDMHRPNDARPWFDTSHAKALRINSRWALAHTYFALAGLEFELGNYSAARSMYQESLLASERLNYAMRMVWAYIGISNCAMMTGNIESARHYAIEGLRVAQYTGAPYENTVTHMRVAECCCDLGEIARAIDYLRQSAAYPVDRDQTKSERMGIGASILLRAGLYHESLLLLSCITEWSGYDTLFKMDTLRIEANLRALSERLGGAALERARAEVAGKSIDDMHAMMYALLERGRAGEPPAVVATG